MKLKTYLTYPIYVLANQTLLFRPYCHILTMIALKQDGETQPSGELQTKFLLTSTLEIPKLHFCCEVNYSLIIGNISRVI